MDSKKSFSVSHLDCTLRDGGYYNNWDFDKDLVVEYLDAMGSINIDVVELGFRSMPVKDFRGAYFYTNNDTIKSLNIDTSLNIGVMLNASDLVSDSESSEDRIKYLFNNESRDLIYMVRIACHFHEVEKIIPAAEWLKKEGYVVGINLMQIAGKDEAEIQRLTKIVSESTVDILYFADSLGSLEPKDVEHLQNVIGKSWNRELGIHTHDNMGNAVSNTLKAIDKGIKWVDSTVTGMGRGPGNAQTEYLILELAEINGTEINSSILLKLINNHFSEMQYKYGWGKNPFYYLAGKYNIHPMYVQKMLDDNRYDQDDILSLIEYLRDFPSSKFDTTLLDQDWDDEDMDITGEYTPISDFKDKDVLVIAGGPLLKNYRHEIESYIQKKNTIVICLNAQTPIKESLINFRVSCHPVRIASDRMKYKSFSTPIFMPLGRLNKKLIENFNNIEIYNFGMSIKKDCFKFDESKCTVPSRLVISYCLALITSGKANKILFAGFDGYGAGDIRNETINKLLQLYQNSNSSLNISSLTPTNYRLEYTSLF